jgi:hypothetical protein
MEKTLKQILTEVSVILAHSPNKAIEYLEEVGLAGMDAATVAKLNHVDKALCRIIRMQGSADFFASRKTHRHCKKQQTLSTTCYWIKTRSRK